MNPRHTVWVGIGIGAIVVVGAIVAALTVATKTPTWWTDSASIRVPASGAPIREILWSPAEPLSGLASDGEDQYEPRYSADGTILVFVRRRPGRNADLFMSKWAPAGWLEPTPIDSINTESDELGPELSRDGTQLFFYSDRPGGVGGYDLWVSRREGDDWGEPVNLGPLVNSPDNEYGPALSPAGDRLYFSSNRARPGEAAPAAPAWTATIRETRTRHDYDLYAAPIADASITAQARPLLSLNTTADEGAPAMSPAGDFLYFASDRVGGLGGFDLYRARMAPHGAPSEPQNLGAAVNSASNDLDPALTSDGFRICLSSDRGILPASVGPPAPGVFLTPPPDRIDPAPRYTLWSSVSREVFRIVDDAARPPIWSGIWPWVLFLLIATLPLALLFIALRSGRWRGRLARLSLVAQCLLVSLLIHAGLASLLSVWKVGTGIIELIGRGQGGSRIIIASGAPGGSISDQIRGRLGSEQFSIPEAETMVPAAPPSSSTPATPIVHVISPPLAQLAEARLSVEPSEPSPRGPASPTTPVAPVPSSVTSIDPGAMPALPEPAAAIAEASQQLPPATLASPAIPAAVATRSVIAQVPLPTPSTRATSVSSPELPAPPVRAASAGSPPPTPAPIPASDPTLAVGDQHLPTVPNPGAVVAERTGSGHEIPNAPGAAPALASGSASSQRVDLAVPPGASVSAGSPVGTLIVPEVANSAPARLGQPTVIAAAPPSDTGAGVGVALPKAALDLAAARVEEAAPSAGVGLPELALPAAPAPSGPSSRDGPKGSRMIMLQPGSSGKAAQEGTATIGDVSSTDAPTARGNGSSPAPSVPMPSLPSSFDSADTRLPEIPPVPVETFPQRAPEVREELVRTMGGSEATERAVGQALAWFAAHQEPDGHWSSKHFDDHCGRCSGAAEFDADSAITGMALLCYLGAGHTHLREGPYQESVRRGLQWLVGREAPDGDLRRGETMYGQTVATVALCEALAMTQDPFLAGPARRAVGFVLANATGGKRKDDRQTSVLGWLVFTVESARRAGIQVPRDTFDAASKWLDYVALPGAPGEYAYAKGKPASAAMTAEAMFVRQILGHTRDEAMMEQSARKILGTPPKWKEGAPTFYWYYATLALFQHQGESWTTWNEVLVHELLEHQRQDGASAGSWDPQDEWSKMGGRLYQTAVCTLSLEVYYRYRAK